MASILCRKGESGRNTHTHTSVAAVRACQLGDRRPTADAVDDMFPRTPQPNPAANPWAKANKLREAVVTALALKPSGKRQGWFAINVPDGFGGAPVKFYRVTQAVNGRVYVDVQASDEYYPVKTPASLELVLGRITAAPKKAAELYASSLGKCYRCGRTLTDETSRSVGMGPECRSKL